MSSTFWTNTIWYILLGISSIFELVYTMIRAEKRKISFAFFLTILGITLNFEMIILIFMKAYTYYPMIFSKSADHFNNVLQGNHFSQLSISATILLAVVLNLRKYWYFIFAAIYGIIEEAFLALGIYRHNWYQTWMTVVLLPFAFWIAKKMYTKIIRGIKPVFYYVYIYFALFPINVVCVMWSLELLGYLNFSTKVLPDPIKSWGVLYNLYFELLSISMMLIYFLRLKHYGKALVILMLYTIYFIGYKLNLIWIKEGFFLPVSTVTIFCMYLSIFILDRLYGGHSQKNPMATNKGHQQLEEF